MKINVTIDMSFDSFKELMDITASTQDSSKERIYETIQKAVARKTTTKVEEPEPDTAPEPQETTPAPDPAPAPQPSLTIVEVRSKLADLRRNGKRDEIKDLLKKFGADKLTEVPEDKYPELMEKAEML